MILLAKGQSCRRSSYLHIHSSLASLRHFGRLASCVLTLAPLTGSTDSSTIGAVAAIEPLTSPLLHFGMLAAVAVAAVGYGI